MTNGLKLLKKNSTKVVRYIIQVRMMKAAAATLSYATATMKIASSISTGDGADATTPIVR